MSDYHLLMYCDEQYIPYQNYISETLLSSGLVKSATLKNHNDLHKTDFYYKNKTILDAKQGAGYCLWKPYYILETLKTIKSNQVLLYMDSLDWIFYPIKFKDYTENILKAQDYVFFEGGFPQKEFTRYDTFYLMECLDSKYTDKIQLEAGIILSKNTPYMIDFFSEWLEYCTNPQIIMNVDNLYGSNFNEYKDHRYDQSVLTNLVAKHNLNCIPMTNVLRTTFECNYLKLKKEI